MEDAIDGGSLITAKEAEEVAAAPTGPAQKLRTPTLIFVGLLIVVVLTLLIVILLSLHSNTTGWQAVFPFLDHSTVAPLQTN